MDYGVIVKIKKFEDVPENVRGSFSNEMQKYSGKVGKIVSEEVAVENGERYTVYRLDTDNGIFFWREDFLSLV